MLETQKWGPAGIQPAAIPCLGSINSFSCIKKKSQSMSQVWCTIMEYTMEETNAT